jgi:hypothetical protein
VFCPEQERLALEYRVAVDAFRDCVYALKDLRGFEFDLAYKVLELRRIVLDTRGTPWTITSRSTDCRSGSSGLRLSQRSEIDNSVRHSCGISPRIAPWGITTTWAEGRKE